MSEDLRSKAKALLEKKEVDVVIGYGKGSNGHNTTPVFITQPEDVEELIWNQYCLNNLSVYLIRDEVKKLGKPAVVAKGCDIKSIVGLIQENQVKREDFVIIGMECKQQFRFVRGEDNGHGEDILLEKCKGCQVHIPKIHDFLIKDPDSANVNHAVSTRLEEQVEEIEKKPPEERWQLWRNILKRCIKCYACRQVCSLCYCERCIVDKTRPQWIYSGSEEKGNLAWNIVRSYHLAGRCIECGECERVCPMNIPLSIVNKKMAMEMKTFFDYQAGEDVEKNPALSDFDLKDDDSFIR